MPSGDNLKAGNPENQGNASIEQMERLVQERTASLSQTVTELEAQRRRFIDAMDMLPAYVVLLTPDYRVSFANRIFRERFGESHGKRCYEFLFGRTEPCEVCETFKVLTDMQPRKWEWTGPDGCVYDVSDFPFTDIDGSTLILEMGLDITQRKKAETELNNHREHLDEMVQERTAQLEEVNASLRFEISEHMRTAQSLVEARDQWERTFNSVPDLITILDKDHMILRVNKAMAERLDKTPEACVGLTCYQTIHGHCRALHDCPHAMTMRDGQEHVAEMHEDRLGGDFLISTTPLADSQGRMIGSVHVARDITDRKRIEEALRKSQDDLNRAQAVSHTGSWRLDIRRNELHWSDENHRIFGIPKGTPLTYETFMNAIHPEDRERMDQEWRECMLDKSKGPYDTEHRIVVGDEVKWVREQAELEFDGNGELIGGFGTTQDITERKLIEGTLRESREDLNRAQAVARAGSWRLNVRRNELLWSDENHRIFGLPKGTPMTYETFLGTIHPDDREMVDREWQAGLRGAPYDIEHRIIVDGRIKWVHEKAELEFDELGDLIGGFGVTRDITHIRQTEEALRKSEERYRSLFNSMNEGFALHEIICDENDEPCSYRVLEINPAYETITGLKRENVVGKTIEEYLPGHDPKWIKVYGRVALTGEPAHFDNYSAALDKHFELFAYSPAPRQFAVVFTDISERKQAEDSLKEFNRTLEMRIKERTSELENTVRQLLNEVARRIDAEKALREGSRLLDGFFQHSISPFAILDPQFNFIRVNEAYAQNNHRQPEDFIGLNHFELFPHEENQWIFEEVVRTKRSYQAIAKPFVSPCQPERGTTYWDWTLTPLLDDRGEVESLFFSLKDVTEQTLSQEQIKRVNVDLERRMRQLRALTYELTLTGEQERRQMAEVLHDDLQQLLVATKMNLDRIGGRTKEDARTAELVEQATGMLKDAISRTRDLSQELSPPMLRQQGLADTLQWLVRKKLVNYGLKVLVTSSMETEPDEPVKFFVFRAVQECLFNVVKHAQVDSARVTVEEIGNELQVTVEDHGQGFDAAIMGATNGHEMGFGLFSIQERCEMLGGKTMIESAPGEGCRLTLTIPMTAPPKPASVISVNEHAPAPVQTEDGPQGNADGSEIWRVLLVDDQPLLRQELASIFEDMTGIEVVGEAASGPEAIEMVASCRPGVIVMDFSMPGMTGAETTRLIKRDWPHIRVIGFSMHQAEDVEHIMLESGAEAYLSKDMSLDKLVNLIVSGPD